MQLGHQGRGEGLTVMISHGVEISIAGGVGEKVQGLIIVIFFSSFFFSFF